MFSLACKDERKIAFSSITDRQNINYPFSKETNVAGKDWMNSSMNRHNLSLRTPPSTSLARVVVFNNPKVDQFFTMLAVIQLFINWLYCSLSLYF